MLTSQTLRQESLTLNLIRGLPYKFETTLYKDENSKIPANIENAKINFKVREYLWNETVILNFDISGGAIEITSASDGIFTVKFSGEDTNLLKNHNVFDCLVETSDGEIYLMALGSKIRARDFSSRLPSQLTPQV